MMEHDYVFFGKDIRDATEKGLTALNLPQEAVDIEILEEGRRGFLGALGSRPAKVKLTVRAPYALLTFIEAWIKRTGLVLQVEASIRDNTLDLTLEGADAPYLVGKHGNTIRSLRYLFLTVSRQNGWHLELELDVAGYFKRRRGMLIQLAREKAEKVKKTGLSVRLMPMKADERRLVHLALQNDPDVETYSVGVDPARYVVIRKKQARPSSGRKR
ncbi:MAG: RNA-binding protein Jag [Candidatus Carbobacillus altaicus]|uniref:RNA-binding protein KhpB n=1 Tax=Candidatus Carbonibacillus altaicus TaxID=2163959 RepID=A0A2R6Y220_9BACL|nr:MAG: RNA-binding protein Jag [Candidatus Carbobacillus altaicus]